MATAHPAQAEGGNPPRSCSVLELSVPGGGIRRGEIWVASSFEGIREPLAQEFLSGDPEAAYLAVCYGEAIALWLVQHGELAERIDLRQFMQIRVDELPPVSLAAEPAPWLEPIARAVAENYQGDGAHAVSFEIDWERIAARVSALAPPLLGPSEHSVLRVPDSVRHLLQDTFTVISDGMPLELGRHVLGS